MANDFSSHFRQLRRRFVQENGREPNLMLINPSNPALLRVSVDGLSETLGITVMVDQDVPINEMVLTRSRPVQLPSWQNDRGRMSLYGGARGGGRRLVQPLGHPINRDHQIIMLLEGAEPVMAAEGFGFYKRDGIIVMAPVYGASGGISTAREVCIIGDIPGLTSQLRINDSHTNEVIIRNLVNLVDSMRERRTIITRERNAYVSDPRTAPLTPAQLSRETLRAFQRSVMESMGDLGIGRSLPENLVHTEPGRINHYEPAVPLDGTEVQSYSIRASEVSARDIVGFFPGAIVQIGSNRVRVTRVDHAGDILEVEPITEPKVDENLPKRRIRIKK